MDNVGRQGLDAAVAWGGVKIWGYDLQRIAAQFPGLTGRFLAQNVDYADGLRTLWLYFEANVEQDVSALADGRAWRARGAGRLFERLPGAPRAIPDRGRRDAVGAEVADSVLPYGHQHFLQEAHETKNRYIRRPVLVPTPLEITRDPLEG
jgi:hypothetical protein